METKEPDNKYDNFSKNKEIGCDDDTELINEFINSLNSIELKAMNIAKEHLKSSFNIRKSNGFQEYIKSNKK
jgi:hypothetical protein